MGVRGYITKIRHAIHDEHHWLTRRKLLVFGSTLILVGVLLGFFESTGRPERTTRPDIVTFVPSRGAGHTREWNVDPDGWETAVARFLLKVD